MRFLCIMSPKPGITFEQMEPHFKPEATLAWASYRSGWIRDFYMTDRQGTVVGIMESDSVESIKTELAKFPLFQGDMLELNAYELRGFMNWSQLFDPSVVTNLKEIEAKDGLVPQPKA